jgi:hypothetical protein
VTLGRKEFWIPTLATLCVALAGGVAIWVRANSADIAALHEVDLQVWERVVRLEVLEADDRQLLQRCSLKPVGSGEER